mmetsp:Transcript_23754/g.66464  ORF Transcript_23754/g.66464 Transcript_23754/m.66464 type:complete len:327 (+) Transcript_23754:1138-2118(+)
MDELRRGGVVGNFQGALHHAAPGDIRGEAPHLADQAGQCVGPRHAAGVERLQQALAVALLHNRLAVARPAPAPAMALRGLERDAAVLARHGGLQRAGSSGRLRGGLLDHPEHLARAQRCHGRLRHPAATRSAGLVENVLRAQLRTLHGHQALDHGRNAASQGRLPTHRGRWLPARARFLPLLADGLVPLPLHSIIDVRALDCLWEAVGGAAVVGRHRRWRAVGGAAVVRRHRRRVVAGREPQGLRQLGLDLCPPPQLLPLLRVHALAGVHEALDLLHLAQLLLQPQHFLRGRGGAAAVGALCLSGLCVAHRGGAKARGEVSTGSAL